MRARFALLVLAIFVGQAACQSTGCSSLSTTPGGYPPDDRQTGALQIRATKPLFDFLNTNGTALLPALLPMGSQFNIPPQCTGTTQICCSGTSTPATCTLDLDFEDLAIVPTAPDVLKLTTTFKLKTDAPLPVAVSLGLTAHCNATIDTSAGTRPDLTLTADLHFVINPDRNTTRINVENAVLTGLEADDLSLNAAGSDALCALADTTAGKNLAIGLINMQFQTQIGSAIEGQECQKCTALTDCNAYATTCTSGLCTDGNGTCVESLGLEGRLDLGALLASFAPGLHAMIDIYAVAGGYATVDTGASLGMLGGAKSAAHSACVPQMTPPGHAPVALSPTYSADTATGVEPGYQLAIGVSQQFLERAIFGTVDSGGLCIAVGTLQQPLLTASTLTVLVPSLADLITDGAAPMYILTRPETPPKVTLRKGTYTMDPMTGQTTLSEPLIELGLDGFEIDFYALIAERYVRIFTAQADLTIGLGLQVNMAGEIVPVLGDLSGAFKNVVVKNSELLAESPTDLAQMLPTLLGVAVGQLASALKPIALPALGSLKLQPRAVISTDPLSADDDAPRAFLGIFADLAPVMTSGIKGVRTTARLVDVTLPARAAFPVTTRGKASPPSARFALGVIGSDAATAEWAFRIDGGVWSPYSSSSNLTIADARFWLIGDHKVEIKARHQGAPRTEDPSPVVLTVPITLPADTSLVAPPPNARASGCSATGNSLPSGEALFAMLLIVGFALRRRAFVMVVIAAFAVGACGGHGVTDRDRMSALDLIGRQHSTAGSEKGIFIAAYDQSVGDLAYAHISDVKSTQPIDWLYVDGIAAGAVANPMTKRRHGVADPGPDVGRYPAIALTRASQPYIAYYDATNHALKVAVGPFPFTTHTIQAPAGPTEDIGRYPAIVLSTPDEKPQIAYLATGLAGTDSGTFRSELRIARANVAHPKSAADWTIAVVDQSKIPCAGRCVATDACVTPLVNGTPDADAATSSCVTPTTDCATACASGEACIATVCQKTVDALAGDIVEGAALWISMLADPTGILSITYYDRSTGALRLATELPAPQGGFSTQTLDGGATGVDVGEWTSATMDTTSTIHVAYVDAIGDTVRYATVKNRVLVGMPSVIDDGVRDDGIHPVGGSATLAINTTETTSTVYVYYQDQRDSMLLEASRSLATTDPTWTRRTISTKAGDGFAIQYCVVNGQRFLTHYEIDRSQADQIGFLRLIALDASSN